MISEIAQKLAAMCGRVADLTSETRHKFGQQDWDLSDTLWQEVVDAANTIVSSIAPGAFCVAQEWDERIDCLIKLPDGRVAGEMIRVSDVSEGRLRATAERLLKRFSGEDVQLVNALWGPVAISPQKPNGDTP